MHYVIISNVLLQINDYLLYKNCYDVALYYTQQNTRENWCQSGENWGIAATTISENWLKSGVKVGESGVSACRKWCISGENSERMMQRRHQKTRVFSEFDPGQNYEFNTSYTAPINS